MTQPTNHWKLGLFVVISVLIGLGAVVYFGASSLNKEAVTYTSYFDEAVTGLEVGSPARFRGVTVGSVSAIDVAPDHRLVEVRYDLGIAALARLKLANAGGGKSTKLKKSSDLRAQLSSTGVTGVKYVLIDFFDEKNNPPPPLSFKPRDNYIPAAQSMFKNLEDAVTRSVDRFPELADDLAQLLRTANHLLQGIDDKRVPDHVITTLDNADQALIALRAKINQVPAAELSQDARNAFTNLNQTMVALQAVLARIDGDHGLVASMQRATDTVGDVAGDAHGVGDELTQTLRGVREASDAIRQTLDALDRDSDMLLKGRSEKP